MHCSISHITALFHFHELRTRMLTDSATGRLHSEMQFIKLVNQTGGGKAGKIATISWKLYKAMRLSAKRRIEESIGMSSECEPPALCWVNAALPDPLLVTGCGRLMYDLRRP